MDDKWDALHHKVGRPLCFAAEVWRDVETSTVFSFFFFQTLIAMAQLKNSSGIPSGGGLVCDENDKWDARFHRKVGEPQCFSAEVWRDMAMGTQA